MERIKRNKIRKRRKKKRLLILSIICIIGIITTCLLRSLISKEEDSITDNRQENEYTDVNINIEEPSAQKKEIIITMAGDCTLGTDTKFNVNGSFNEEIKKLGNDYSKIMRNVANVFQEDDYTIVNLETTFTESTEKAEKGSGVVYHFKGPKDYVNILTSSSIEGVTISNNHSYDYGQKGLDDTRTVLRNNKVDYCGYGDKIIKEIKGNKIGILGYSVWWVSDEIKNNIKKDIEDLIADGCNIIIPYFHWGEEGKSVPNEVQQEIGRFAIDSGATMVVGSHSHVIQTIENYKGKLIAYSLGNFSFGGNSNPSDKRTYILQSKFIIEGNEIDKIEYKIIPTFISSTNIRNDYAPTIASGKDSEEILSYIGKLSPTINFNNKSEFFSLK